MNKLKAAVFYEYSTKIKAMGIFYAIQYFILALIFTVITIVNNENGFGSNTEISSIAFVSVVGVLGYKEDFRALMQNGYTRKYIFFATISMFVLMTGLMALIDTAIGNLLHYFIDGYFTVYGTFYGYGNVVANWLCLTALYLLFCSLFYFAVLVIHKVGKTIALYLGVALGGLLLLTVALFQFVFSKELVGSIAAFFMKAMGFMENGSINHFFPIITLLIGGTILGIGSYFIIRRTELK